MAASTFQTVRVTLDVSEREVSLRIVDPLGRIIEDERFRLEPGAEPLPPATVARDAFDLLYQGLLAEFHDRDW